MIHRSNMELKSIFFLRVGLRGPYANQNFEHDAQWAIKEKPVPVATSGMETLLTMFHFSENLIRIQPTKKPIQSGHFTLK